MTLVLYENTFITLSDAETYFASRPDCDEWNNASNSLKEKALAFASNKINRLNFVGNKVDKAQPMAYPRDIDDEIPLEIQYAVCEEALAILEKSVHQKNQRLGISSFSLGNASFTYASEKSFDGLLSPEAYSLVSVRLQKGFEMRG